MNIDRVRRLITRIRSRFNNYDGLYQADSLEQSLAWAASRQFDFLNGNVLRAKIVQGFVEQANCTLFVETGTSHAATAIGVNRFLNIPVWSCEIHQRDYRISRFVTFGISGISLANLDSRAFLRDTLERLKPLKSNAFFYLDAHEGELDQDSLPLAEEIRTILELDSFVVMIDDFHVPDDDGFRWGTYGGVAVDIHLIRNQLLSSGIHNCYFPAYTASTDTGYKSGYCLFWRSEVLDRQIGDGAFPHTLLRTFSLLNKR